MNLVRLKHRQHPRPPHRELRQKRVLDSGFRTVGDVANLYADGDMDLRFVDVRVSGFLGFGSRHHLVPAEAVAEESPGTVTLKVDQQTVEGAPRLAHPHDPPDEDLQREAREHFGLGALL